MLGDNERFPAGQGGLNGQGRDAGSETLDADSIMEAHQVCNFEIGQRIDNRRINLELGFKPIRGRKTNVVRCGCCRAARNVRGNPGDLVAVGFPAMLEVLSREFDPTQVRPLIV